ncbi:uncharacterized protein BDR25DRAFT_338434 [Lindgomyces ingoldianus]|uniref:Uncharacterized protein n=1 Tax=Lindgomyces ingoldianus TaxID=673940 RepID=A0ACB6RF01_9PLEO|nr:uncharacterized protein BDR25DRAFT_338434 [Lindgomyces ingoldianus]KAF2477630.1 hypothetical protein BDR25DRAFT_338434 [Lindgomyces ingoldianus]
MRKLSMSTAGMKSWLNVGSVFLMLLKQYCYARICLFETGLEEAFLQSPVARVEILRKCLASIKALYNTFLPMTLQPLVLVDLPSHLFAQSNHAMSIGIQLSSVRCEGWSGSMVEDELQMMDVLDSSIKSMDNTLKTIHQLPFQLPEFFIRVTPLGKEIRKWYAANLRAIESSEPRGVEDESDMQGNELDLEFLGQFLDMDDNLWLQSMLVTDDSQMGKQSTSF